MCPNLNLSIEERKRKSALNEWDLIKLIKFWEGGEGVDNPESKNYIYNCIHILSSRDGRNIDMKTLLSEVFGTNKNLENKDLLPSVGTVQIITRELKNNVSWDKAWKTIEKLAKGNPYEQDLKVKEHREHINAIAGMVQGLLDFPYIEIAELADVFQPLRIDEDGIIGVHKGTLLQISKDDRVFNQCSPTIGISPYLIVLHAVLLYNQHMMELAFQKAEEVESAWDQRLQEAKLTMNMLLQKRFLPNVFHYPLEKFIYEQGHNSRGLIEQKISLGKTMTQIEVKWNEYKRVKEKNFQRSLQIFGVIISFVTVLSVIDSFSKGAIKSLLNYLVSLLKNL